MFKCQSCKRLYYTNYCRVNCFLYIYRCFFELIKYTCITAVLAFFCATHIITIKVFINNFKIDTTFKNGGTSTGAMFVFSQKASGTSRLLVLLLCLIFFLWFVHLNNSFSMKNLLDTQQICGGINCIIQIYENICPFFGPFKYLCMTCLYLNPHLSERFHFPFFSFTRELCITFLVYSVNI